MGVVVAEEARVAARWAAVAPDRVLRVRLEDVLARPDSALGDLRAFLGRPQSSAPPSRGAARPPMELLTTELAPFYRALAAWSRPESAPVAA